MAAKTYGEYLEPVNQLIDESFPEGKEVTPKDLKVIAAFTAATIFEAQSSPTENLVDNKPSEEEQ
ncbi:hypothetical protein KW801_03335 [Candidatus Saccharibacteria bacterium]|nr:hypothetical protein [Candidatus Saccharibacteria bacterium]